MHQQQQHHRGAWMRGGMGRTSSSVPATVAMTTTSSGESEEVAGLRRRVEELEQYCESVSTYHAKDLEERKTLRLRAEKAEAQVESLIRTNLSVELSCGKLQQQVEECANVNEALFRDLEVQKRHASTREKELIEITSKLKSDMKEMEQKNLLLKERGLTLKTKLDALEKQYQKSIEQLNQELSRVSDSKAALEEELMELKESLKDQGSALLQLHGVESEKELALEENSRLNRMVENFGKQERDHATLIENLQASITAFELKNQEQSSNIAALLSRNREQESIIAALEAKNHEQGLTIAALEEKNQEQRTNIAILESKNRDHELDMIAFQKQVEEERTKSIALYGSICTLQESIEQARAARKKPQLSHTSEETTVPGTPLTPPPAPPSYQDAGKTPLSQQQIDSLNQNGLILEIELPDSDTIEELTIQSLENSQETIEKFLLSHHRLAGLVRTAPARRRIARSLQDIVLREFPNQS